MAAKFSYESMRTDVLRVYAREEFSFGTRDYAVRREICWELNRRRALMKLRRVNENFLRRAASLVITLEGYTLEIFGWREYVANIQNLEVDKSYIIHFIKIIG